VGCDTYPFLNAIYGRAAIICAGGTSVIRQVADIRRARRELGAAVIGVNETGFRDEISGHFAVVYDWNVYEQPQARKKEIQQRLEAQQRQKVDAFQGLIFAPRHLVTTERYNLVPVPICGHTVYGLTCDWERGLYSNGGGAGLAISVALYLGACPVLLCGYDYREPEYWYGGKTPNMTAMLQQRDGIASLSALTGDRVINCSPDSTLSGFPKMDLKDALSTINKLCP